ncbi:hypothetical protein Tco_1065958 [Tanacetum coccineum]
MQSSSNQIGLHFPNLDKSLQFRPIEVSESENLSLDHIHGEDKNVKDVQIADHLRPMEELLQIPIIGIEDAIVVPAVLANEFELKIELLDFITGGNLMSRNTQEALTIIENKSKVRTCRNKPQVSSSSGSSTQIDTITALTKQVEVLGNYIASMQKTNNRNQEATIQLMQNQMGQMAKDFQERPLDVLPSNTKTNPLAELNMITSMDGLTLDESFIPHSNFLVYQEKEQESKTIMEVVEISSSQSTPLDVFQKL